MCPLWQRGSTFVEEDLRACFQPRWIGRAVACAGIEGAVSFPFGFEGGEWRNRSTNTTGLVNVELVVSIPEKFEFESGASSKGLHWKESRTRDIIFLSRFFLFFLPSSHACFLFFRFFFPHRIYTSRRRNNFCTGWLHRSSWLFR